MSSSSIVAQLDLDELVGSLSCREIVACLPPGTFRASVCRRKMLMKKKIGFLSDELKSTIFHAACTKSTIKEESQKLKRKRKREEHEWGRRLKQRTSECCVAIFFSEY